MKYLKQLREIEGEIHDNMGKASQKIIDIIQDTICGFERGSSEEPIRRDELGAINYQICILLEIWNPALQYDIDVLKRCSEIIEEWYKEIEFINKALGLPRES